MAGARENPGIQSLDAALTLLAALAARPGPAALSDIARDCSMPPSKAHRYLASFLAAGFVTQAGKSGKYDLGPAALEIGLAAIGRNDFVNRAADGLADLAAATRMTALLSVWGNGGATVVRWERAESPAVTSMGLGTTLPLLNSATGRAFLAWAPPAAIRVARDGELANALRNPSLAADFAASGQGVDELAAAIRAAGYASVDGRFIPGLVAVAAPVLDWQGEAQAVVTLIGTDPAARAADSTQVLRLIAYCREKSAEAPRVRF